MNRPGELALTYMIETGVFTTATHQRRIKAACMVCQIWRTREHEGGPIMTPDQISRCTEVPRRGAQDFIFALQINGLLETHSSNVDPRPGNQISGSYLGQRTNWWYTTTHSPAGEKLFDVVLQHTTENSPPPCLMDTVEREEDLKDLL